MGQGCEESICVDKPSISQFNTKSNSVLFKQTEENHLYPERPLYRTEFGNSTWKVLHRISAFYPDKPSDEEKDLMSRMIKGLSIHFPCPECRDHYKNEISVSPVRNENRRDLVSWMCYQHNQVNKRLGKDIVDCQNIDRLIKDFKI